METAMDSVLQHDGKRGKAGVGVGPREVDHSIKCNYKDENPCYLKARHAGAHWKSPHWRSNK